MIDDLGQQALARLSGVAVQERREVLLELGPACAPDLREALLLRRRRFRSQVDAVQRVLNPGVNARHVLLRDTQYFANHGNRQRKRELVDDIDARLRLQVVQEAVGEMSDLALQTEDEVWRMRWAEMPHGNA